MGRSFSRSVTMNSSFLVSTATLRQVIEQSAASQAFREAFIGQLTERGVFSEKVIPSVKLGMLIGAMTADKCVPMGDDMNAVYDNIRNLDKLPYVRLFHLGELITVAGGRTLGEAPFVANDGMDGLRALISYMTNAGMMTDSAVREMAPSCRQGILAQHPWLAEIDVSVVTTKNHESWLIDQVAQRGEWHPVAPLVNTEDPTMTVSDLHRRDARRMKSRHPLMKSVPISASDVGKIFVASIDGQSARIMPRAEFLRLPVDSFDCWEEISEFDVNQ